MIQHAMQICHNMPYKFVTTCNANMSQHAMQICHNMQCKYVTTCNANMSQHAILICHNMPYKFVTTCNANMSQHAMQICPSTPYRHYCTVLLLHFKTLPTISITAGTLYPTLSHYLVFPPGLGSVRDGEPDVGGPLQAQDLQEHHWAARGQELCQEAGQVAAGLAEEQDPTGWEGIIGDRCQFQGRPAVWSSRDREDHHCHYRV